MGAFGPQLKPYGRDFKLFGYVNGDGKNHLPPLALVGLTSFTHTNAPQTPPPGPHFTANDNLAVDQLNIVYGGKLVGGAGAFAEVTYDGVRRSFTIDNLDIKRAWYVETKGGHVLLGLDVNNRPTVQDLWNSTPTWGFPYNASALAPTPHAKVLLDGELAQRVVGLGVYSMWNDLLYTEFTAYSPVDNQTLSRLGVDTPSGSDAYFGTLPYWRVAVQHNFGGSYLEAGAYGISARRFPGGDKSQGADSISDVALDATYQYTTESRRFISAHATWLHENERLDASRVLLGTKHSDHMDTVRGDVSYSYEDTWTPTIGLFETTGSRDPFFFITPGGTPDSQGYIIELAFVPFGKVGSPLLWANARFTVQWVAYTKFDGARKGASANNTLFLSSRFAIAPLAAYVRR